MSVLAQGNFPSKDDQLYSPGKAMTMVMAPYLLIPAIPSAWVSLSSRLCRSAELILSKIQKVSASLEDLNELRIRRQ